MSLRDDAIWTLSTWRAPDATGERLRRQFLRHLERHTAGLWRDCTTGHITTSVAVLDPAASSVLLTFHRRARAWRQLGGHCERSDATIRQTALREASEESGSSGIRLLLPEAARLDRYLAPCHPGGTTHFDIQYVAVAPADACERVSAESDDLRWFGVDDLPTDADDALRSLVRRAVWYAAHRRG